jgi:hypothetical protein
MALRKLASRLRPSLLQAVSSPRAAIDQAIAASPLAPARAFWDALRELEDWWPLLIPLLLWVFWRTYQRERAALGVARDQS